MAVVEQPDRPSDAPAVLPRGVRLALDAVRAEPGRAFRIADLAAAAGSAPRTLQRQFQAFLGKTPLAAVRDIRFERARRELLQGSPTATVMDVALRAGLPHLGRFALEYRSRYGETPSQTLQRRAAFLAERAARSPLLPVSHDRPLLAVGPIEASARDAADARDMAEELATLMLRAGAAVTSRPQLARYHLLGRLRRDERQSSLTLRLIDAATGRYLWAHRLEGVTDLARFEEQVASGVVGAIQPSLRDAEIERARRTPDADLTAYDLTLRALPNVLALDADGNARALDLLERAMSLDPDHASALALAAWCHAQRSVYNLTGTPTADRNQALRLARRALTLGGDATVLTVLGNALSAVHDLETADLVTRKALALDGSSAWAWSRSAWIDVYGGRAASAIERFTIALELAPHDPLAFNNFVGLGCAHFHAGRYADAARWQQRAMREHPSAAWVHRTLCPAYALAGAEPEARQSRAALRQLFPELTAAQVTAAIPLPPSFRDRVADGLVMAGLPA